MHKKTYEVGLSIIITGCSLSVSIEVNTQSWLYKIKGGYLLTEIEVCSKHKSLYLKCRQRGKYSKSAYENKSGADGWMDIQPSVMKIYILNIYEMKFYHGTTKEKWNSIKKEGVLRGIREAEGMKPNRCTYLAVDKNEAKQYGEVVLEVEYEPKKGNDNYCEGCWQVRVYEPILVEKIKLLDE